MALKTKSFSGVTVKDADKGEFSAVVATFNVVDKDGDVTLPGAFESGTPVVVSSYMHTSWRGALPIGKGVIRQTDTEAIVDGQFFLQTTAGRETFEVVKELGELQEWSYSVDPAKVSFGEFEDRRVQFLEKLKGPKEVSPVLEGAGINTRTLAVKGVTQVVAPHKTEVVDQVVAAVPDDAKASDLRSMAAWIDPAGDPELKSTYEFLHHGPGGAANLRACVMGIAKLNAAAETQPWTGQKQAIYDHLAGHIRDFDREPPELRSAGGGSVKLSLVDEVAAALDGASAVADSASRVVALRAQAGKQLSNVNVETLGWLVEQLETETKRLRQIIIDGGSGQDDAREQIAQQHLRLIASSLGS